jgi:hypothetical protein
LQAGCFEGRGFADQHDSGRAQRLALNWRVAHVPFFGMSAIRY